MMIPRTEIQWIDAGASIADVLAAVAEEEHSRYPVCRGGLDDVIGVIAAHSLLRPLSEGRLDAQADLRGLETRVAALEAQGAAQASGSDGADLSREAAVLELQDVAERLRASRSIESAD